MLKRLSNWLLLLAIPCGAVLTSTGAKAADYLSLTYGAFQRSVPMSEVRQFAETQVATGDLQAILRMVPKEEQGQLLQALNVKLPLGVVAVNNLLNTELGKQLLTQGSKLTVRRDKAGSYAISGGLLTAAGTSEGLSLLTFLESYPAETVTIDLKALSAMTKDGDLANLLGGLGR